MTEDRPKRGEARRRRTRGQILKAASALFYAEGVRAVGVDRVAATANVSKRTLYNHFPSKDDLILAYLEGMDRRRESDAPALEQVLETFTRIEANAGLPSFRGCPFVKAATEMADPDHPASLYARGFKLRSREWLAARLDEAGIAAPESLAAQLAVLIDGALVSASVARDLEVVRAARTAAETLIAAARRIPDGPV